MRVMIIKTILLVDDNFTFLKAMEYALKSESLKIITATNVKDALNNINKIRFDLIISDYDMGYDNGLSILSYIKRKKYNSKFIMLTGSSNDKLQDQVEKENGIFIDKGDLNLVKYLQLEINNC